MSARGGHASAQDGTPDLPGTFDGFAIENLHAIENAGALVAEFDLVLDEIRLIGCKGFSTHKKPFWVAGPSVKNNLGAWVRTAQFAPGLAAHVAQEVQLALESIRRAA